MLRLQHRVVGGRDAVEPAADRDDEVGFRERLLLERQAVDRQVPEMGRMVGADRVLLAVGGHHAGAGRLGEFLQLRVCVLEADHLAGEDDGLLRPLDQLDCRRDRIGIGPEADRHRRLGDRRLALFVENVLRHGDHHRTGTARDRQVERVRDDLGHLVVAVDVEHRLGDGREHHVVVDLLERLAPLLLARDVGDEQHDRAGRLLGGVDADRGVGRAGRAAADHDGRLLADRAVGVGGEGG